MSQSRKILLGAGGAYLVLVILAFILFGTRGRQDFVPQEEFELPDWISLGVFTINKAVFYLIVPES